MIIRTYDAGDSFTDRYTVIIDKAIYGMSDEPLRADGFNQYCGDVKKGSGNYGKKVAIEKLPLPVRKAIVLRSGILNSSEVK